MHTHRGGRGALGDGGRRAAQYDEEPEDKRGQHGHWRQSNHPYQQGDCRINHVFYAGKADHDWECRYRKQALSNYARYGSQSPNWLLEEKMDRIDHALLVELDADPRCSTAELARRVELSVPTVRERLRRLHEQRVIRGYHLDVDPAALGYPVSAFVRVRPGPGQLPKIAALAQSLPEVSECHRITGEDCFLLRVHATGIDTFEQTLDLFLLYGQTTTSIVQSTPVPPRTPGLPAPPTG